MLNLALNVHSANNFSQNNFTKKIYFDEVIFCPSRLTVNNIFHCITFLPNRIGMKVLFHSDSFLPNQLSKKKYIRSVKKVADLLSNKIKNWVVSFFTLSIELNIYKSIAYFFVQHDQQQKNYFGHVVFFTESTRDKKQKRL